MGRAFSATFGALLMLAAGACSGILEAVLFEAPNHGDPISLPGGGGGRLEPLGVDREFYVGVGPPEALLRVWLMEPAEVEVRGTILVLHGWRNKMSRMRGVGEAFREAGYRVVLVDLRGHGGSSGDFITFGARESRDLKQVLAALEAFGRLAEPLGGWGISMGGATLLQLTAEEPRIRAVVAVAPYTSLRELMPHAVRNIRPVTGWTVGSARLDQVLATAAARIGFDPEEADALRAIGRSGPPVLILHGAWDAVVPVAHGRALHEAAPDPSELVVLAWAGHLAVHFSEEVRVRSVAWFDRHLAPEGTGPEARAAE